MGRLTGKVAIITGAARGQGAAHARLFAREGAKLLLTDVREVPGTALEREIGSSARFVAHDIADAAGWGDVVSSAERHFGGVDILINNAGIVAFGSVQTTDMSEFDRVFRINTIGAVHGIQAVIGPMRARGGGSIVNVSSIAGLRGAKNMFAYSVSKWALRGIARSAAQDLAGDNIRVNTVLPGLVSTPMAEETASPEALQRAMASIPLGRAGGSSEVSEAVLFLASDASAFMTGAEMVIDGGSSA